MAVLALIVSGRVDGTQALAELTAGEFYVPAHAVLFEAAFALLEAKVPMRVDAIRTRLEAMGKLDVVQSAFPLEAVEFWEAWPDTLDAQVAAIKDAARVRRYERFAAEAAMRARDRALTSTQLVDWARDALTELETGTAVPDVVSGIDAAQSLYDHFIRQMEGEAVQAKRFSHGLSRLDEFADPVLPHESVVLAARPSVGKTALALHMALSAAQLGEHVVFVSQEITARPLLARMIAWIAEVDSRGVLRRDLGEDIASKILRATDVVARIVRNIEIIDRHVNAGEIYAAVRKLHAKRPVSAVFVDYLQILKPVDERKEREEQISKNMKILKHQVSNGLQIPTFVLSQINRDAAKARGGAGRPPQLSDLRESGSIEQDADRVYFLHRDEEDANQRGVVDEILACIVAKNRDGAVSVDEVTWQKFRYRKACGRFEELR